MGMAECTLISLSREIITVLHYPQPGRLLQRGKAKAVTHSEILWAASTEANIKSDPFYILIKESFAVDWIWSKRHS